jgi:hypothetical protein
MLPVLSKSVSPLNAQSVLDNLTGTYGSNLNHLENSGNGSSKTGFVKPVIPVPPTPVPPTPVPPTPVPPIHCPPLPPAPIPCFHKDVELLCYDELEKKEIYKKVKDVAVGDLVKTFACENMYSKVKYHKIRYLDEEPLDKDLDILYQHKQHNDIKITGRHSMIYDKGGALNYSGKTDRFLEDRYAKFFYNKIKPLQCMDKISTLPVHMDENFEPCKDTVPYVHMICVENVRPNVSVGLYLKNELYCESCNEVEMGSSDERIKDYDALVI